MNLPNISGGVFIGIAVVLFIIILIAFLNATYHKVRPNEVMIITGAGLKEPKVIKGGGAFVLPILQQWDVLDLSSFTLPLTVESNTNTQVPLVVNCTATLNVGDDSDAIATAGRKFLGLSEEVRNAQLSEIVKGIVRGILGNMSPEAVSNNRKNFSENVAIELEPKLKDLGIEVASIQINDVTDENGYLDSLYAEDVANKKADAEVSKAKANARARAVRAEEDQKAQQAEQDAEQLVAERKKETAIAKAKFKADQDRAQAIADQAYQISEAEASKETITKEGEANAIRAEKDAILAKAQVEINKARLESEIIAKTSADAEALKIRTETEASTRKTLAEAERFEKEQEAIANGETIRQKGIAEAESIRSTGLAEAESKAALAEALSNQGQAVLQQLIIDKLPEIAKAFGLALSNIDNMTVFNGAEGVTDSVTGNMAQMFKFVKDSTGLDLVSMAEAKANGTMTLKGDSLVNIDNIIKETPKVDVPATEA